MATFWSILSFLFVGALAGWLAGKLVRGRGFGLIANVLIGIIGALLGGVLADQAGIAVGDGFVASLATALVGALVLLLAAGLVRRVF